ncbi:hypothetical protein FQA39_LY10907 [Lamprigera yunnana]|nr:hypothetical protein FQA39_LY10907 [Lamprigera yunnana]
MNNEKVLIRIEDMCGNEIYLSWELVLEVWSLETVLSYRLSYSSASNFKHFYDDVIRAMAEIAGDANTNLYNIVNRLPKKFDDVRCMLEVLLFMPEKALFDVQLERCIQEQEMQFIKKMYAEQYWTKAIDLKSAVERLYEKVDALEFDADHEAIYGMEESYTVEEREQLRDKYKIGRKYCVAEVIGGINLSWGGSTDPAAFATLTSIGALGVEENKKHSKALSEFINKELAIPSNRMYISFHNIPTSDLGYNGTTFHEILS